MVVVILIALCILLLIIIYAQSEIVVITSMMLLILGNYTLFTLIFKKFTFMIIYTSYLIIQAQINEVLQHALMLIKEICTPLGNVFAFDLHIGKIDKHH